MKEKVKETHPIKEVLVMVCKIMNAIVAGDRKKLNFYK